MSPFRLVGQGAWWATLLLMVACSSSPTQVIVEIDADVEVREAVEEVRVQVYVQTGTNENPEFEEVFRGSRGISSWPARHVLAPLNQDASRRYMVMATGIAGTDIVSRSRVIGTYIPNTTAIVQLHLNGGPCLGVSCDNSSTCRPNTGLCGAIPFIPPTPEGTDASMPDAGADGAMDAGPDAPAMCDEGSSCTLETARPCAEGIIHCDENGEPSCDPVPLGVGTECKPAGVDPLCDPKDVCDGIGFECPIDILLDLEPCGDRVGDICINDVCQPCVAEQPCDANDGCMVGTTVCEGGARCDGLVPVTGEVECRAATLGGCDLPELCAADGTCPVEDRVQGMGFSCRPTEGHVCDIAEVCNGIDPTCPDDLLAGGERECSAERLLSCEQASVCDGMGRDCPVAPRFDTGTECRPASDSECGISEQCGDSGPCPTDRHEPDDTLCRGSDLCDGNGNCSTCGAPCDAGDDCHTAINLCDADGSNPVCTINGNVPNGDSCNGPLRTSCEVGGAFCMDGECGYALETDDGFDCGPSGPRDCVSYSCNGRTCEANYFSGSCQARDASHCLAEAFCTGTSGACPEPDPLTDGESCGDSGRCFEFVCGATGCEREALNVGVPCGGDTDPTDCRESVCSMTGSCTTSTLTDGTTCGNPVPEPPACDEPDSCLGGICQDNTVAAGDSCLIDRECHVGQCDASGTCRFTPYPDAGMPCNLGVCDGVGMCHHVVISEVSHNGGFIELFNPLPAGAAISLSGCTLDAVGGTSWGISGSVGPRRFFLVGGAGADSSATVTLDRTADHVTLRCNAGRGVIDSVAWGTPTSGGEGTRLGPISPAGSLERKACEDSTAGTSTLGMENTGGHSERGNAWDENNNASDFIHRSTPRPQNSSQQETMMCLGVGI